MSEIGEYQRSRRAYRVRQVRDASVRLRSAAQSRDDAIRAAHEEGIPIREIAAKADLSPGRIHQILHGR